MAARVASTTRPTRLAARTIHLTPNLMSAILCEHEAKARDETNDVHNGRGPDMRLGELEQVGSDRKNDGEIAGDRRVRILHLASLAWVSSCFVARASWFFRISICCWL